MGIIDLLKRKLNYIFGGKKSRMSIYVIGVLWIAVIMQFAVNYFLKPNSNLLEAFSNTNMEVSDYELEMVADYGSDYLNQEDKKNLVAYIGNQLNLQIDNISVMEKEENTSIVYFEKIGKNAETLIKVVSIEQDLENGAKATNHYLIVRLKLYQDLESILDYRKLLEQVFTDLNISQIQTTMQLCSKYRGKLGLDEMNSLADSMINNLQGHIAYANRSEELFTIYAYSGLLDEYISSLGTKINIHIAMDYDEEQDSTIVYLGTPVINGGY